MVMLAGNKPLAPAHDASPDGRHNTTYDRHALAQGGRTQPARPAERIGT